MTGGAPSAAGAGWIDSHCHLQGLDDLDGVLARAAAAGVETLVCVGTDLASSREAVALAEAHPQVWAVVGLHPHEASRLGEEWDGLVALARHERVVGIGETGLDFHYLHSPRHDQEASFRAHVGLARETDRALVVHTREAWDDTFRVLAEEGMPERTVLHCFTGGPGEARRGLDAGAALSFSGIVTFKNAADVREAAARCPAECLLVETDTPFLAPTPHRGRPNEPAYLPHVGEGVARARGEDAAAVADATAEATRRLFRLPPPAGG